MAGGISIHAVDVVSGQPAAGLFVAIRRLAPDAHIVGEGCLMANGTFDHPMQKGQNTPPGLYEVTFSLGAFYRSRSIACPFLEEVPFRFTVSSADEHVHLPIKFSPWGYALFRGA